MLKPTPTKLILIPQPRRQQPFILDLRPVLWQPDKATKRGTVPNILAKNGWLNAMIKMVMAGLNYMSVAASHPLPDLITPKTAPLYQPQLQNQPLLAIASNICALPRWHLANAVIRTSMAFMMPPNAPVKHQKMDFL